MTEVITDTDLTSYPGVVVPDNELTLAQAVEYANGLVSDVIGDLDPIPFKVKAITLEVAARGLRYSDGASSVEKSIDDWKKVVRYEGPDGLFRPGYYLTEDEIAKLRALMGDSLTRVGAIKLQLPWGTSAADTY